ncbi:MAG TPA: TrkH family potassium uptake protein [Methanoregula sp.]|nr:TrkH family potassium uptake protein [Methanoregula sp.]
MHRPANILTVIADLGDISAFIAPVTAVPLLVAVLYGEWDMVVPMGLVPVIFFILGVLMKSAPRGEQGIRLSTAMCSAALFWLLCSLVGGLPFLFGLHMGFTDAFFEGMAGWTGTAFSMIPSVDTAPHTLLFWRSFMQWLGGIGIIAFSIAMASSTGLFQSRIFRSEGRDEPLMQSVIATGRTLFRIYGILTFIAIGLILFTGLSLWESVNLALSAISTGGFVIHQSGILYYHSLVLELLLIPVMIAGALPFKLYYLVMENRRLSLFGDEQVKLFFLILGIGTAVLAYDLTFFSNLELLPALQQGLFMAVSALTTTGFQTASLGAWASVTLLFLSMLAFIGGASGSTAGGIKLSRVALAFRALLWWFRRFYVSGKILLPFKIEGRVIPKATAELEAAKNMLVIILSVLVVFIATLAVFQAHATSLPITEVVFEVVSAFSTTGFTTGFVSPAMPVVAKWIFIGVMWIGRLEVIPVVMLVVVMFRGAD